MLRKYILKDNKTMRIVGFMLFAILAASSLAWIQYSTGHAALPNKIKKQITFTPYSNGQSKIAAAPTQLGYDANVKVLTYVTYVSGVRTVVSQQPLPENLRSTNGYDKFINSLGGGQSYKSSAGTFYITNPHDAGGGQTVVMSTSNALLFVKPDSSVAVDDWKQFLSTLSTTR